MGKAAAAAAERPIEIAIEPFAALRLQGSPNSDSNRFTSVRLGSNGLFAVGSNLCLAHSARGRCQMKRDERSLTSGALRAHRK